MGEIDCQHIVQVSTFCESPFVSLVGRHIDILIVRFWRSTLDVEVFFLTGLPSRFVFVHPVRAAAETNLEPKHSIRLVHESR